MSARRLSALLPVAGAACLIWTMWRFTRFRTATDTGSTSLDSLYAELHSRSIAAASEDVWPDAAARASLKRGLRIVSHGTFEPVRFATNGPLQCAAFLQCSSCSPASVELVAQARHLVFSPFVEELLAALPRAARMRVRAGVYWPRASSYHMVVTVFSEHPSLLNSVEAAAWKPVSKEQVRYAPSGFNCAVVASPWI